jgi:hypothetical protein
MYKSWVLPKKLGKLIIENITLIRKLIIHGSNFFFLKTFILILCVLKKKEKKKKTSKNNKN